jgi:hypothetical protein
VKKPCRTPARSSSGWVIGARDEADELMRRSFYVMTRPLATGACDRI